MCDTEETEPTVTDLRDTYVTQGFIGVSEVEPPTNNEKMLLWALFWATEMGIPVFPVFAAVDGVCSCKSGAECSSPGKHPIPRLAPRGSKDATTSPEVIRHWWKAEPYANIGGRMGGDLRLLAIDVDPRAGGDASFYDLIEAHGDEWRHTLRNLTGSLGFHLFFTLPEGVEFRRAKLAPGVDLKWHNGYVVLPPSVHVSGNFYKVADPLDIRPAPEWLIKELTRKADQLPTKVIHFQEQKSRLSVGNSQEKFYESAHERNIGLFGVGVGRWRHGWAEDVTELHAQLIEINNVRCVPPLHDSEVAKMAAHIAADYAHLRGVDAQSREGIA